MWQKYRKRVLLNNKYVLVLESLLLLVNKDIYLATKALPQTEQSRRQFM